MDKFELEEIFGSTELVAGNMLPEDLLHKVLESAGIEQPSSTGNADAKYDALPADFRDLCKRAGITKTSLRAMAREMIEQTEQEDFDVRT